MSQLGLILLMFLIGLEFDFSHLLENRHAALSISAGRSGAPGRALGMVLGHFTLRPQLIREQPGWSKCPSLCGGRSQL